MVVLAKPNEVAFEESLALTVVTWLVRLLVVLWLLIWVAWLPKPIATADSASRSGRTSPVWASSS